MCFSYVGRQRSSGNIHSQFGFWFSQAFVHRKKVNRIQTKQGLRVIWLQQLFNSLLFHSTVKHFTLTSKLLSNWFTCNLCQLERAGRTPFHPLFPGNLQGRSGLATAKFRDSETDYSRNSEQVTKYLYLLLRNITLYRCPWSHIDVVFAKTETVFH